MGCGEYIRIRNIQTDSRPCHMPTIDHYTSVTDKLVEYYYLLNENLPQRKSATYSTAEKQKSDSLLSPSVSDSHGKVKCSEGVSTTGIDCRNDSILRPQDALEESLKYTGGSPNLDDQEVQPSSIQSEQVMENNLLDYSNSILLKKSETPSSQPQYEVQLIIDRLGNKTSGDSESNRMRFRQARQSSQYSLTILENELDDKKNNYQPDVPENYVSMMQRVSEDTSNEDTPRLDSIPLTSDESQNETELTPKNCIEVYILAYGCNAIDRMNDANSYIKNHLTTICASKHLKALKISTFKEYLENCNLDESEKLQLVEAKLRCNHSGSDEPQYEETDVEIIKIAARLSVKYSDKYQELRTHCHFILKRELSDLNCIELTIFADEWGLDELKVWAQYYVIVHLSSIPWNIVGKAYSRQELDQFRECSSIPIEYLDLIQQHVGSGEGTVHDMSHESQNIKFVPAHDNTAFIWALAQLRKLSARKTKTIGKSGGIIELDGCSVTFPKEALLEDTDMTMIINTDPVNCLETGMPITPILGVEPSIPFRKPVTVKMRSCFAAERGHSITAQLSTNHGSGWELMREVEVGSDGEISFDVDHFSDIAVSKKEKGILILQNNIFINIKSGLITSHFCRFEKDARDRLKLMSERDCIALCDNPLLAEGRKEELIKLQLTLESPKITLAPECWDPNDVAVQDAYERCNKYIAVDPGDAVTSLKTETYISGKYEVYVGTKSVDSALVKRRWPVEVKPEIKGPVYHINANKLATEGGIINENCKNGRVLVGLQHSLSSESWRNILESYRDYGSSPIYAAIWVLFIVTLAYFVR